MLAKQAEFHAQRLLARPTVFARAVTDSGIHRDPVADAYTSYAGPDPVDSSRAICTHDPWRCYRNTRQSAECEHVEMIQRRSVNAHANFA